MNPDSDALDLLARVREDQLCRWLGDQRTFAEYYFGEHPALNDDPELAVDLIYSEVLLREELGEAIDADEYLGRFPRFADQLRRQFSFHALIADDGPSSSSSEGSPEADLARILSEMIPGYEVLGDLGRGGRVWVYRARQLSSGRIVALKTIRAETDDARRSLRREAERIAMLDHPHILPIYECGEVDERCFWSMELAAGTLAQSLFDGPRPAADASALVERLARGLAEAHGRNIVHGNLKPANVLLMADGAPKLADFGLNRKPHGRDVSAGPKEFPGTPAYLAPEQTIAGGGEPGPAADVHALGAILHKLVTGTRLFRSRGFEEVVERIRTERPGPLPAKICPAPLDAIRLKCLEKNPTRRYADAGELADDLARFREGKPVRAKRSRWPMRW